jgi:hypothetical protein
MILQQVQPLQRLCVILPDFAGCSLTPKEIGIDGHLSSRPPDLMRSFLPVSALYQTYPAENRTFLLLAFV